MKFTVLVCVACCMTAVYAQRSSNQRAAPRRQEQQQSFENPRQGAAAAQQYDEQQQYNAEPQYGSTSGSRQAAPAAAQQYESAAPAERSTTYIPILSFNKEQSVDGSYKTSYETGNHILSEETGFLKELGSGGQSAQVQHGSYSYTSPEGIDIKVTYTADELGYRAEGLHLPTPPPVPAEIQKSLDQIYEGIRLQAERRAKFGPQPGEVDDTSGAYDPKFDYVPEAAPAAPAQQRPRDNPRDVPRDEPRDVPRDVPRESQRENRRNQHRFQQ